MIELKLGGMTFTYADLFAGIGGFHAMLDHAGGRCVYVSEIDDSARATYIHNWVAPAEIEHAPHINTDITQATPLHGEVIVPQHDVLAAGFPCQPFSKSGYQRGMDEVRGTLFWNIARILEERRPSVVLLENVRNIAGPRHRHEWAQIIRTLRELGYRVSDTPSVFSPHLLPPSRGGTPQIRERVFILGTYVGPQRSLEEVDVAPTIVRGPVDQWLPMDWKVDWILDDDDDVQAIERFTLSNAEVRWIEAWDALLQGYLKQRRGRLPGFPLWADVWTGRLRISQSELDLLPHWKAAIVRKNQDFAQANRSLIDRWITANPDVLEFPESRRKLEWQAQDAQSFWDTILHLRPSGIRCKAPTYLPALVAITQTSIVGSRRRRLTPNEAARAQGLGREFEFANKRLSDSYKQVGNGVAVGAAWHVLREHVLQDAARQVGDIPRHIRDAILGAPLNPCANAVGLAGHAVEQQIVDSFASVDPLAG